jgi:hypothetical protein
VKIFLSRPTWIDPQFEEGLEGFMTLLSNLKLEPKTLGVSDYPTKTPLDEVIEIMKHCKGTIVLGYPQIQIDSGQVKNKNIDPPLTLATEWNHIEAALAYANGLPLLLIHHEGVSRGIFDRGVLNAFVHSIDLTKSNWAVSKEINGALVKRLP